MKKILVALATLVLSSTALAANPFQLAHLAYQGALRSEGIPSFGALCSGNGSSVSAAEVIAAGIEAGFVTAEQAASKRYVRAVGYQLDGLCRN